MDLTLESSHKSIRYTKVQLPLALRFSYKPFSLGRIFMR